MFRVSFLLSSSFLFIALFGGLDRLFVSHKNTHRFHHETTSVTHKCRDLLYNYAFPGPQFDSMLSCVWNDQAGEFNHQDDV